MAVSDRGDWLRGVDLNHRPLGYEPNELPDCSTPHKDDNNRAEGRQTVARCESVRTRFRARAAAPFTA